MLIDAIMTVRPPFATHSHKLTSTTNKWLDRLVITQVRPRSCQIEIYPHHYLLHYLPAHVLKKKII